MRRRPAERRAPREAPEGGDAEGGAAAGGREASGGGEAAREAPERAGVFSSLRYRDYRLLWFGVASHSAALWMEQIARPYLVYELTGSPAQLGAVVVARTLPQFAFGVFAGVAIDWFDRKRVLQLSQTAAFVLNVCFAALLLAGLLELWHVYAAAAIRGATMAFDQPARQSLVPATVPADRVTNAIALFSATQNTMRILGTAASGFAIAAIGVEGAFVAIAAVYAGTVSATSLLRVAPHAPPAASGAGAMLGGLGEAMRFAWRTPAIRGAIALALVYFAFGLSFMQLFAPLFALDVLGVGAFGFGVMMSLTGAGSLLGALAIASRSPRRLGLLAPLMAMCFGGLLILFALSTYLPGTLGRGWIALPLALVFAAGLFQSGVFALVQVMVLDAAPDRMRGRLMGLLAFDRATMMAGAAAGGVLAEKVGVQPAQILYALLVVAGALAVLVLAPGFRAAAVGAASRPRADGAGWGGRAMRRVAAIPARRTDLLDSRRRRTLRSLAPPHGNARRPTRAARARGCRMRPRRGRTATGGGRCRGRSRGSRYSRCRRSWPDPTPARRSPTSGPRS